MQEFKLIKEMEKEPNKFVELPSLFKTKKKIIEEKLFLEQLEHFNLFFFMTENVVVSRKSFSQ